MPLFQPSPSRRGFLAAGTIGGLGLRGMGLSGLGMNLAGLLAARESRAGTNHFETLPAIAQSVIQIDLPGGVSVQESWDPKPDAPIEYRGELKAISTKTPGVQFGELMQHTAQVSDKITVVRSLTHGEAAHERGQHNMMTGYRPSPALQYPSLGSVVSHEFGPRKSLPPYVCVPNEPNPYAGAGYLSSAFAAFSVGDDPARAGFQVRDLNLPGGIDQARHERRLAALEAVNESFVAATPADNVQAMGAFYQRAFDLMASPAAREAFNIDAEDGKLRDQYGRNQAGQRMLLARRLVEAGVRFVTLSYGGWDHHVSVTANMQRLMPDFDRAYAALINDLDARGLLDTTLVLVTTEFGRTPKLNADGGRDHWAKVFSVALAGGGTKRGAIVGSSGATATEPEETPVTPEDLATTVFHQLGIAASKELMAPGGRPIEIVKDGRVRAELLA